eukprot:1217059-Pyramimonas_sp.AAC.1
MRPRVSEGDSGQFKFQSSPRPRATSKDAVGETNASTQRSVAGGARQRRPGRHRHGRPLRGEVSRGSNIGAR